jgi:prolipoprotein diacylglyceryl transferase
MSDGTLKVNSTDVPVKIYSTTEVQDLNEFADKPIKENVLVILNESNFEPVYVNYSIATLAKYKLVHYQLLDKNFKVIDVAATKENLGSFKYAVKTAKPLTESDNISLETPFRSGIPQRNSVGTCYTSFLQSDVHFCIRFRIYLMNRIFKIDNVNQKYLEPLFTWTLLGTILGARMGHVIFYQPELFKEDFWSVFLPISTKNGLKFTDFQDWSHGATIALIFTTLYYSFKIIRKNPFWVYDRLGIVVALGGAFVRMGNFFNSEIIGKPVDPNSPFALLFPQQSSEYGVTVPRYPSQLFEAFGYVCLFVLLWILYRKTNKKYQQGWLFGLFFIILWAIRFFVEFLKEPQGDEFIQFGGLNTGQVLSIPFMIAGVIIMIVSKKFKITQAENEKPE